MSNDNKTILEALRLLIELYRDLNGVELTYAKNLSNDLLVSFYTGVDIAYKKIITLIKELENINND